METPATRTTTQADEMPAIDTIVLAFAADPVARWSWPDPHQYLTSMPRLTRAFGGVAFAEHSAYCTADYEGAALWLPPQVHVDENAVCEVIESTVAASTRGDVYTLFGQMMAYRPAEPHWYLFQIGVDPASQGKGYGSALMTYTLEQCDRDHAPAYLESSNPRNISLYQRHGFEALGTIQIGTSPPVVPMLRPAH